MVKKMLINASHPEECRVAIVCDGVLEELDVQVRTHEATLGNIYKAVVSRIEPSLQAVFVDYGGRRNGFLSINDIHPSYFPESYETAKRKPRIQEVFKKGDDVLVQVNKEERSTKGASLTTYISIAGRYLVLMPGTDLYGVSRKIEDETERKKLKDIGRQLKMPPDMGFIIRTAGMGRIKTELSRDLNYLLKLWSAIETNLQQVGSPALLYKEHDLVIRSIREHFAPDISEILVDDRDVYNRAKDFFHQVMPKYENLVRLSQDKRPLFNKYQLEEQIEQVYQKRIKLKSGGYIIIEPTEALVTIDVNSGSATKEKGIEDTAFRVNMEAAVEAARQLRLRDLGGIIVIDFIDMVGKKHNQEVEKVIKLELKTDRAKTKVLRISPLGLLELSRQRLKSSLGTGEYLDCPHCDGKGKIRSTETAALSVFRKIKSLLAKNDVSEAKATVPANVAEYLLNTMRSQLVELESQHSAKIVVSVRQSVPDIDIVVEAVREEAAAAVTQLIEPAHPTPVLVEAPQIEAETQAEPEKPAKPKKRRKPRKKAEPKKPAPDTAEQEEIAAAAAESTIEYVEPEIIFEPDKVFDMELETEAAAPTEETHVDVKEPEERSSELSQSPESNETVVFANISDMAPEREESVGPERLPDEPERIAVSETIVVEPEPENIQAAEAGGKKAPRQPEQEAQPESETPEKEADEKSSTRRKKLLQDFLPFS